MNDTIVIFDRVRENLRLMRREPFTEIVNKSINQTLSRTILTSGLTFLTVLVLFLMGGEVLRAFSFAMVVGVVVGTYSSFGIAAPIVVVWNKYWGRARRLPVSGNQQCVRIRSRKARAGSRKEVVMFDELVVSGEIEKTNKPWAVTLSALVQVIILGRPHLDSSDLHRGFAQGHVDYLPRRSRAAASAASACSRC